MAPQLSEELEQLLQANFASELQSEVRAALQSYADNGPEREQDRVLFDILNLAPGDPARVQYLADLATHDPRDVIKREYFWVNGRSYPHPWARRHAVNAVWDEPPQPEAPALATAELFFRTHRDPAGGKTQLPSLFLTFQETELYDFAIRLKTLAEPGAVLDLSGVLRYQGWQSMAHTFLRAVPSPALPSLTHEGKVLTWEAPPVDWTEAHQKCWKLLEAGRGFQEMLSGASADQQIRIALSPLTPF